MGSRSREFHPHLNVRPFASTTLAASTSLSGSRKAPRVRAVAGATSSGSADGLTRANAAKLLTSASQGLLILIWMIVADHKLHNHKIYYISRKKKKKKKKSTLRRSSSARASRAGSSSRR